MAEGRRHVEFPEAAALEAARPFAVHQWPGERNPGRHDVDETQIPASAFLDRFTSALLHSEGDMADSEVPSDIEAAAFEPEYTYPMAMLDGLPDLPSEHDLCFLQSSFANTFQRHVFINSLRIEDLTLESAPPYLQLSFSCLAAVFVPAPGTSDHPANASADIFLCGLNLWSVMLELDNSQARLLDAVLAVSPSSCTFMTIRNVDKLLGYFLVYLRYAFGGSYVLAKYHRNSV